MQKYLEAKEKSLERPRLPVVIQLRDYAKSLGARELEKATRQLASGKPPQEVAEALTRNLVRKLTHNPSVNLRSAAADGETGLFEAVRTLFHLDTSGKK